MFICCKITLKRMLSKSQIPILSLDSHKRLTYNHFHSCFCLQKFLSLTPKSLSCMTLTLIASDSWQIWTLEIFFLCTLNLFFMNGTKNMKRRQPFLLDFIKEHLIFMELAFMHEIWGVNCLESILEFCTYDVKRTCKVINSSLKSRV